MKNKTKPVGDSSLPLFVVGAQGLVTICKAVVMMLIYFNGSEM